MITTVVFVDVQSLQARVGGSPAPSTLVAELANTMHGLSRDLRQLHAYCAPSVDLTTRNAYRDVGFAIHDTSGTDDTLIEMTLDLAACLAGPTDFEETILIGRSNYSALARLLKSHNKLISISDRTDLPPSLEALTDGVVDIDEIVASRIKSVSRPIPLKTADRAPSAKATLAAKADEPAASAQHKQQPANDIKIPSSPADKGVDVGTKSVDTASSEKAAEQSTEPKADTSAPKIATAAGVATGAAVVAASADIAKVANGSAPIEDAPLPRSEASNDPVSEAGASDGATADDTDSKPSEGADIDLKSDSAAVETAPIAKMEKDLAEPMPEPSVATAPASLPDAASAASSEAAIEANSVDGALEAAIEAELDLDDLTAGPADAPTVKIDSAADKPSGPDEEPEVAAEKSVDPEDGGDTEVDDLLSKLIADGLHSTPAADAPTLDVVPER
ncbi:MAG: hypothetical protein AAF739_08570 [Pseudomonadota bacterium]